MTLRRVVGGLAVAAWLVVGPGGPSEAGAQGAASSWTSPLGTVTSADTVLAGRFAATGPEWAVLDAVTIAVRWAGRDALPRGCTVPPARTVPLQGGGEWRTFSVPVRLGCNGDYVASAAATSSTGGCPSPAECPRLPDLAVAVAAPGPAPTGLTATVPDGGPAVELDWQAPDAPPPDFLGSYRVERSADGGAFAAVATASATSWTDEDTAGGGTFSYRVVALRSGPGGQPVASSPSSPAVASVDGPADGTGPGGGSGPGGAPGTGPGSGGAGPGADGTGSGASGGAAFPGFSGGLDLTPPAGPRAAVPGAPALDVGPPTTVDGGYRPTLDYGQGERAAGPGGTLTRVPGDAAGTGAVVETVPAGDERRRQVLVPVAAAMALFVGAAQLLHLTRRAAPRRAARSAGSAGSAAASPS